MFLLLVDSHSKWIDIHITNSSTTAITIEKLQFTFSSLGLPEILVTDNGPSFSSSEFTDFVKANGIQHIKTVPYHLTSNGLAKGAVQTFKACMKKLSKGPLQDRVNSFLFKYRTTPQTTTGVSPAELLMGRKLRTHLDLLVPNIRGRMQMRQSLQKHSHDFHAKDKQLQEKDSAMAKNFSQGPLWITGKILNRSGAATFLIELPDGRVVCHHSDQLKATSLDSQEQIQPHVDEQWLPESKLTHHPQEPVSSGLRHSTQSRHRY